MIDAKKTGGKLDLIKSIYENFLDNKNTVVRGFAFQ